MTIDEWRKSIGLLPMKKEEIRLSRPSGALLGRLKLKQKAVEFMGGKCKVCGYCKCMSALDFHHKDPQLKRAEISKIIQRVWWKDEKLVWNQIVKELEKCVLLCCRCHRELESGYVCLPK